MKRFSLQLVFVLAAIFALGCGSGKRLPAAADQALSNSSSFEVLSLNPDPHAEKTDGKEMHGWNVLGDTAIKDSGTRTKLIAALKAGVAENDGAVAACFNPRHGIKVTDGGKTHDFVICFECYQVQWYIDGNKADGFLITDSPQPTFDQALMDADVPLADKPRD